MIINFKKHVPNSSGILVKTPLKFIIKYTVKKTESSAYST